MMTSFYAVFGLSSACQNIKAEGGQQLSLKIHIVPERHLAKFEISQLTRRVSSTFLKDFNFLKIRNVDGIIVAR